VQLFTLAAETLRSFSTSSAVLPDAIASLICLHETAGAFFFAAIAGEVTSASTVSAETSAKPIVFNSTHPPSVSGRI